MVQSPVRWGITFPDQKTSHFLRPSLVKACQGNEGIARLLDYFIYQGSIEVERQNIDLESCKVVILSRSHKQIMEKLQLCPSHKTLITYLDLLTQWKMVVSERYGRSFTVNFAAIQERIDSPPPAKVRKPRSKSCKSKNVVTLQHLDNDSSPSEKPVHEEQDTTTDESCNVTTLLDKFTTLQLSDHVSAPLEKPVHDLLASSDIPEIYKVVTLQLLEKVEILQLKVVTLQLKVESLQLSDHASTRISEGDEGQFENPPITLPLLLPLHSIYTPNNTSPENPSQGSLAEEKRSLTDQRTRSETLGAALVTKAEELRGRVYSAETRKKELAAAAKLLKRKPDITVQEFTAVFTKRNDAWWQEHNGLLNVTDLAATPRDKNDMRYILMLEQLQREKPTQKGESRKETAEEKEAREQREFEEANERNRQRYERLQAKEATLAH